MNAWYHFYPTSSFEALSELWAVILQASVVAQAMLDIIHKLAPYIPRSQHLIATLPKDHGLSLERTSQVLFQLWQVTFQRSDHA